MPWQAVGNSYEITLIFIAFAFGCNMGCSVVVSKLFGAKDFKGMKTAVYTACIFSAFCMRVPDADRYPGIRSIVKTDPYSG